MKNRTQRLTQQLFGAIAFYTTIPISARWSLSFTRIARWSPMVGTLLGLLMVGLDFFMSLLLPIVLRSAVLVCFWIFVTGALHLDGAMDSADGLGVFESKRRLEVMKDSLSGAFGVLAGLVIVLLKVLALAEITRFRWLVLLSVPTLGRWAHVMAVGQYPYLKKQGKGAMHCRDFVSFWDYAPGCLTILGLIALWLKFSGLIWLNVVLYFVILMGLAWVVGYWFFIQFKGMTGDIYGAIVEWTETLMLLATVCLASSIKI